MGQTTLGRILTFDKGRLISEIKCLRNSIRKHRDAKGDDRCWLDDYSVWQHAVSGIKIPRTVGDLEVMMQRCVTFYETRRADSPDLVPPDAIKDPQMWDRNLVVFSHFELSSMLRVLQVAIVNHYNDYFLRHRKLTIESDRTLYAVLPEKIPADFRLPPREDFLGEALAPKAGCPSFWRSHQNCNGCDLTKWGPCN